MSQIKTGMSAIGLAFLMLVMIAGCGTPNDKAPFDAATQGHTADWILRHAATQEANISSCAECHGADLAGGISMVSCTQCHLGGPYSVHPLEWGDQTALNHAAYSESTGAVGCANINCHGASLLGGTTGPSCSSCHLGGTMSIHPADWAGAISEKHGEYVNANTSNSCGNVYCHGQDLLGVPNSGPPCNVCHAMP
jgi:hypothetical protein